MRRGAAALSSRRLYVARMSPRSREGTKRSPYVRSRSRLSRSRGRPRRSGLALGLRVLLPAPRSGSLAPKRTAPRGALRRGCSPSSSLPGPCRAARKRLPNGEFFRPDIVRASGGVAYVPRGVRALAFYIS
jgi:hypothetical protein